ncbi:RICIN domain-containing protein [Luteibacter yeojuensis]|uniref:Ricin B lectin domain-containing protein n=1 Tax=Luteibacter yeojuensis TaxID=345309 RepID=A0A0F3L4B4_9GAMM|nr:ricin-type beta-trefoil lectin domain protein [Luteibacter yeojuensis]KJV37199.1 hypothetical protein VI08_01355 [Luteibacter yeojuensis]
MTSSFPTPRSLALALAVALATAAPAGPVRAATWQGGLVHVDGHELADASPARAALLAQFEAGAPVLVRMDAGSRPAVARVFGAAPSEGDAIFVREAGGDLDVLRAPPGEAGWSPRWTAATAASLATFQAKDERPPRADVPTPPAGDVAGLPMYKVHEGQLKTNSDEITGTVSITVFRSATATDDDKEIHVTVAPVITPAKAGVDKGHEQGRNITGAYLPWAYRTAHEVTASGVEPALVHYAPVSAGPSEFEKTEIDEREVGIGGSQGNSISEDGQADAGLAAKLPFNFSASYRHLVRNELRYTFPDYSMYARPVENGARVQWDAPINEMLKHVLVEHAGADRAVVSEKRMTPMMRSATLPTTSVWELPGDYEGIAHVTVQAGYDLNQKEWRWDGPQWVHEETTPVVMRSVGYDIDLSHPFLTRETTVLLRTSDGVGDCLAQKGGKVVLAPCDKASREQMWGLDSERRYINRANGECLEARIDDKRVVTAPCSLVNAQAWHWRADRIHSAYGNGTHRLHVDGGDLRFFVEDGTFDDIPLNPHHDALKPWAGYPKAPIAGELVPAPFGRQAGHVPAALEGRIGEVGPEQRWTPIVLRAGML